MDFPPIFTFLLSPYTSHVQHKMINFQENLLFDQPPAVNNSLSGLFFCICYTEVSIYSLQVYFSYSVAETYHWISEVSINYQWSCIEDCIVCVFVYTLTSSDPASYLGFTRLKFLLSDWLPWPRLMIIVKSSMPMPVQYFKLGLFCFLPYLSRSLFSNYPTILHWADDSIIK
jgi:hypothetical protein